MSGPSRHWGHGCPGRQLKHMVMGNVPFPTSFHQSFLLVGSVPALGVCLSVHRGSHHQS